MTAVTKARYSPIAPIALLHELAEEEIRTDEAYLGSYLLLLTHDVLANQASYATLAGDVRHRYGDSAFIMMDNSVVELGSPMHISSVLEAADVVAANCIMTPDVLGSFSRTQAIINRDISILRHCDYPLMRIPQGSSMQELILCVDWLRETLPAAPWEQEYWGIPRWVANQLGSRERLCKYILMTGDNNTKVHLLGMSKNVYDDLHCSSIPGVMGIDSANPLVCGHNGYVLDRSKYRHLDRGDFWERTELNERIKTNVRLMHGWVGNHG